MARDALDTMRSAMSLHETVAATEQAKGPAADLRLMADAMGRAADLASQIAQIEDRRGITAPVEMPERLKVVFVDGADVCCRCGGPNVCETCGQESPKHNKRTMEEAQAAKAKAPLLALPAPSPEPAASASPAPAPGQARAVPVAPKPAPAPPRFTSIHDAAEASGAVGVSDRGIAFSGGRRDGFSPADGGTPTW